MTARIFLKLIAAVLCILAVSLFAVDYVAARVAERLYDDILSKQLQEKCQVLATSDWQQPDRFHALAKAVAGRLTAVARDGRVIAESDFNPAQMENHRNRPEIAAALAGQVGISRRPSTTANIPFLYLAIPIPEGALRLAVPLSRVDAEIRAIRMQMLGATTLAFLPAIVIAGFFARYVSSRLGAIIEYAAELAQGNFRVRMPSSSTDEFGVLSARLNETGEKLQQMFSQLQKEQSELEKLETIRKDFVINVSHELRTPLASIQGYAETLLDGALEDQSHNRRFVQIIRQNAERLTRLTADLLSLSRLELKTQRFQPASYYINALLEENRDSMLPLAAKKHVALVVDPAPDKTEAFCDAEAMHHIMSNLVDNAVKYTPEGGTVTIGARLEPDGAMLRIFVRDTGTGIPKEDLPRLFERFYRVDKARSRELGGTGLGLAIVKHLARSMGGDVGVESQLDQGSSFWFTVHTTDPGPASPDGGSAEVAIQ